MSIGFVILCIYVVSVMHMHFRGVVRFSPMRQALTHINYLAPYNLLMDAFSSLPKGGGLIAHRDPFAGSLRYHLGLSTPNHDDCYILVDGQRHSWRDGLGVLFDETFIHEAHNKTEQNRIILFCDVKRPMKLGFVNTINEFMSNTLVKASATQNDESDAVGVMNRLFSKVYVVRMWTRKLKRWNKPVYKCLKYILFFALVYWLFISS